MGPNLYLGPVSTMLGYTMDFSVQGIGSLPMMFGPCPFEHNREEHTLVFIRMVTVQWTLVTPISRVLIMYSV
jgi:hypothetical protein